MKPISLWIAGAVALSVAATVLVRSATGTPEGRRAAPASTQERGPVRALDVAVPFELEQPYTHFWRAEQPSYTRGWIVVLEVDPALVHVTERAQPVLCAGVETLERVNHGEVSGRVVAIVPQVRGGFGDSLEGQPFWFASPALPESLTLGELRGELARASEWRTFSAAEVDAARARGGSPIAVRDRSELDLLLGALVAEHAPDEIEKADALRVPLTR